MSLISQSDLEARLGRTLTPEEVTSFTIINSATQRMVEEMIGSSVEQQDATTRYYDGGLQHLRIDPCTDISEVKYTDDYSAVFYTLLTSDYTNEPINKTLKTMIRHRSGKFMTGINNITVTAKFSIYGDSGILNIVKSAMLDSIVAEMQNANNVKKESIEGYSVEYVTPESKNAFSTIRLLFPEVI